MVMDERESVIRLLFLDGKRTVAELTLAAGSAPAAPDLPSYVPDYIRPEGTSNVPFAADTDDIDGRSPIVVYSGEDPSLSPILLLEETEYEMMLSGDIDSAFGHLSGCRDTVLRRMHLRRQGEDPIYTLYFRGYVGKGYFDVVSRGKEYTIPFEVRSKKIDYLKDYPRMLGDISEFSAALLLSFRSPLYGEYSLGTADSDTLYEDFMVLDYIFNSIDIIGAYGQVCANRHCVLRGIPETVPAGTACDVDPSDLPDLVVFGNLFPMDSGPVAGRYAPLYAVERDYADNFDTPENRIVKDTVLTVQRMVHRLISALRSDAGQYMTGRLAGMRSEIDRIACDPWFEEVGGVETIPFGSTVLQGRAGYAEMFSAFQMLGLGAVFRQNDLRNMLRGGNTRVYQVYEYWCYTRLYRCLYSMSENKPPFPLGRTDGKWEMTIRRNDGIRFRMAAGGTRMDVTLHYNRSFGQSSQEFKSYSVGLRPDFTLLITLEASPGRCFIINFDAKYKAKPMDPNDSAADDADIGTDCWEFDLYKMHTYRDALMHSFGSYVLYPGTEGIIFPKPMRDEDWDTRQSLVIPSVGAVPLIPGDDRDVQLEKVLKDVLSAIAEYSEGEILLDPRL